MTPVITVTPSNYRWLLSGGLVPAGTPSSDEATRRYGGRCGKCRHGVFGQMEYAGLFRRLRGLGERERERIKEGARSVFKLKSVPSILMTMGGDEYYI